MFATFALFVYLAQGSVSVFCVYIPHPPGTRDNVASASDRRDTLARPERVVGDSAPRGDPSPGYLQGREEDPGGRGAL